VLAVVIVIILIVAAEIKIIYPSKLLHDFFFFISIIEIALALAVASFWNRWKTWALVALVFATWGGYSLYPAIFGLPCYCLGVAVDLPKGTSLAVNLLMVILSWVVLRDFGISRQRTIRLILLSFVLAVIGFACAAFLYSTRL
jgi:hypothetical protein